MNTDIANAAIKFLARVDLKGAEVPAFNMVINALEELTTAEQAAPDKADDA